MCHAYLENLDLYWASIKRIGNGGRLHSDKVEVTVYLVSVSVHNAKCSNTPLPSVAHTSSRQRSYCFLWLSFSTDRAEFSTCADKQMKRVNLIKRRTGWQMREMARVQGKKAFYLVTQKKRVGGLLLMNDWRTGIQTRSCRAPLSLQGFTLGQKRSILGNSEGDCEMINAVNL